MGESVKQRMFVTAARPGYVDVMGTVGPDGSVTEAHVVRSQPPGKYDKRALEFARGWRFRPKIVDGVVVTRPFEQRIVFGIDTDLSAAPADFARPPALAAADGDLVPLVRVAPEFPQRALATRTSGWVRIVGIVDQQGKVKSARAAGAHPRGLFEHAALGAVRKWRFKPRVIDGQLVEREFEQTINFEIGVSGKGDQDPMHEFVTARSAEADVLYAQLRGLCPDQYPHADDAPNEALRITNGYPRPPLKLTDQVNFAKVQMQQLEPCLFSSWEQLHDPKVYDLAARLVELDLPVGDARRSAAAIRAYAARLRDPNSTIEPTAEQRIEVRSWIFLRLAEAYHELLAAQAQLFSTVRPSDPLAIALLDRTNAAYAERGPREARSVLLKGLKKIATPESRLLPLLMLARVQTALGEAVEARATLESVLQVPGASWNLMLSAHIARAILCGRLGETECFESSLGLLEDELGVADRLGF